ncbi:cupin [Candidatus Accumulibacter sp. ACC007]|uniref:cupin n=1 Tax=Candidatus Accumulibacter sp. ACC007 TaxID=2823333 RepID=UPI0025BB8645|nr:cupin [Candidatus Accumulibacter sp. ACC007]
MKNIFAELPPDSSPDEQFLELLARPGLRIERIVSTGQASAPGFWYEQALGEWIVLLQGEALLRFEDPPQAEHLKAGDCVNIAPRRRHRVDWTLPGKATIWLAVHYELPALPV